MKSWLKRSPGRVMRLGGMCLCLVPLFAKAQLVDITQATPWVAGGGISKSLSDEVGSGRGDINTEWSSEYVIARDPARAIRRGRQLFQRKFTMDQGQGPRVNIDSSGDIMANPALGAGLSDSCASCHGRPRGSAGFGGDVATRPDSRNAPHLFGIGLREMIADEMTSELRVQRTLASQRAVATNQPVTYPLSSKRISSPFCRVSSISRSKSSISARTNS